MKRTFVVRDVRSNVFDTKRTGKKNSRVKIYEWCTSSIEYRFDNDDKPRKSRLCYIAEPRAGRLLEDTYCWRRGGVAIVKDRPESSHSRWGSKGKPVRHVGKLDIYEKIERKNGESFLFSFFLHRLVSFSLYLGPSLVLVTLSVSLYLSV